ncbi:MAG: quinone-dependent dihydroorotate dehydrogenase [Fluviibacter sp.]
MNAYSLLRPLLFSLSPETAHNLSLNALDRSARLGLMRQTLPADPVTVMGIRFPNRVGLAAGLDKDGAHIDGLATLGFGFIEIGTVTPKAQPGNLQPRLFRLPAHGALINRFGFNNLGVDHLVANVRASQYVKNGGIIGINIGKNANTPIDRANDDYLIALETAYAHAHYVTINISSPNTQNLRSLQQDDALEALLAGLKDRQQRLADLHGRYVPLALKIAPDLDDLQIETIASAVRRHRFDAVIATNTTLERAAVMGDPLAGETGGLSGKPVFEKSTAVLKALHQKLAGEIPLIGVGGISTGEDAIAKREAGAELVQIYTGLIYQGPRLIKTTGEALARYNRQQARPTL